jgi:hypothetical protein
VRCVPTPPSRDMRTLISSHLIITTRNLCVVAPPPDALPRRSADGRAAVNGAGMEAVNKAVAKAASAASASTAGKAVAGHVYSGQTTFSIYDIGTTVVAELIIRYSQRQKLVRARCGGLFACGGGALGYLVS